MPAPSVCDVNRCDPSAVKRKTVDMVSHLEGFGAGARRAEATKPSKCGGRRYAAMCSASISAGLLLPRVFIGLLLLQIKCIASFLFRSSTLRNVSQS